MTEWYFPHALSQSTIGDRNGSNACAFICLYFGQMASKGCLIPSEGLLLPGIWKEAIEWAIISGNDLHDELFDNEGVNVNIDEAVEVAGEVCGVVRLGEQRDLFGSPKQLLGQWLTELSQRAQTSYHLFFSAGKAMFIMFDSTGNLYFSDSHSHGDHGALIACALPGAGVAFADWMDEMMNLHWNSRLVVGSVTEIFL